MCREVHWKTEGPQNQPDETVEGEKGLRSAVNASIRALDQVNNTNMDIEEYYVANYEEPPAKRHNSSDKGNV